MEVLDKQKSWKNVLAVGLLAFILVFFLMMFISRPENNGISAEKARLEQVEKEVEKAINSKDTTKAKMYLVQLTWQYAPGTIGGQNECEELKKIWNDKRNNYLTILGEDTKNYK